MTSVDSTCHSNQPGTGSSTDITHQLVMGCSPDPGHMWTLVATWARDINTDPHCDMTIDPDNDPQKQPRLSPWFMVAMQATQIGMDSREARPLNTNVSLPQAPVQLLVMTRATDNNTGPLS